MVIKNIALSYLLLATFLCSGQENKGGMDSLLFELVNAKADTNKVLLLDKLSDSWQFENTDSIFKYARKGLKLADSLKFDKGIFLHKLNLGHASWEAGDYPTAINLANSLSEHKIKYEYFDYLFINSYRDMGDHRESLKWIDTVKNRNRISFAVLAAGYYGLGEYDSALFFLKRSMVQPYQSKGFQGWINMIFAKTYERLDKPIEARFYYQSSIKLLPEVKNYKDLAGALTSFGRFQISNGSLDSAIYLGNRAYLLSQQGKYQKEEYDACLLLANVYERKGNAQEALRFFKSAIDIRDKIYGSEKQKQIEGFKFTEELRKKEEKNKEAELKAQLRIYTLSGVLIVFVLFMTVLYRNNRQKQKVNATLQKTLNDLKSTQSQLIQSEKMASLGELTAGIAHEIQNPLNFVNNFSEVSNELIEEIQDLRQKTQDKNNETEEDEMLKDISQNLEKINHHGKRASDIVKGMLQHSRTSSGQKELTDINALCDEYLRLSYHGYRAKDKSFNAKFETDFDQSLPKINVVPQDIGRLVLNLINNAFYAVSEKAKLQTEGYEPTVSVSTKKEGDKIQISVRDNGSGIPDSIKEKIFQPFFTTKPTGQGTGLGLSLSYGIVKAHGGKLTVETNEGKGSEFIIRLPY